MIVITGRMTIPSDKQQAFFEISERQVLLSRKEAGCLNYWYFEDVMEPGTFFFYEEWKDHDAVSFHFEQDYCLDFVKKLRDLTSAKPDMHIRTIAEKPAKPQT
ncbi:MAG: putative quinol monooxygenase [Parvibaculum sp.]|nr:putative quinol monooxygenase [Parvibaculum sp.]